jgi:Uma2 family endonuclease
MAIASKASVHVLPLESGDRLTRHEFERRYNAMPSLKKAELIEGVVYVAAALRYRQHGRPHSLIMGWLTIYESATPGVEVADNTTVRLDLDNEPQPDALLRIDELCGGQSRISDDDYIVGAPELIVEIAASSASYDLYDKKQAYRRNGVKEYIVWQVAEQQISWFCLTDDVYQTLEPDTTGIIYSQSFPGLNLNVTALLAENLAQVLLTLQQGIETEVHQAFVKSLEHRR